MAKKSFKSKKRSSRNKYSLNEKRAYWMGVGASVAVHDNFFAFVALLFGEKDFKEHLKY